jgi:hypothetical protein
MVSAKSLECRQCPAVFYAIFLTLRSQFQGLHPSAATVQDKGETARGGQEAILRSTLGQPEVHLRFT